MAFFVSCPRGEKKKMHNSEFQVIIITHKKVQVGRFLHDWRERQYLYWISGNADDKDDNATDKNISDNGNGMAGDELDDDGNGATGDDVNHDGDGAVYDNIDDDCDSKIKPTYLSM